MLGRVKRGAWAAFATAAAIGYGAYAAQADGLDWSRAQLDTICQEPVSDSVALIIDRRIASWRALAEQNGLDIDPHKVDLIRNGRVPTPGIGIVAANEGIATRLGIEGVVVLQTAPGSPAQRAGLAGIDPGRSGMSS